MARCDFFGNMQKLIYVLFNANYLYCCQYNGRSRIDYIVIKLHADNLIQVNIINT